jgi:hypothetical protein
LLLALLPIVNTIFLSDPEFMAKLFAAAMAILSAAFRKSICSTKVIPSQGLSLGAVKPDATVVGKLEL